MLSHIFLLLGADILLVWWNVSKLRRSVIGCRFLSLKPSTTIYTFCWELSQRSPLHKLRKVENHSDHSRLFGVLAEHHFQDLSFLLLSVVALFLSTLSKLLRKRGGGGAIVRKCRQLVNLISRQCKDVNDHVFKRFVLMPVLKEELP